MADRKCVACGVSLAIPKNWTRISLWRRQRPVQCRSCKGFKHGMSRTRLYRVWQGMLVRCGHRACANPAAFKYYIERGIKVCEEWHDFPTFARWALANGYAQGLTIDRLDSNLGYQSRNARWVTMKENLRARRDRKLSMAAARQMRSAHAGGVPLFALASQFDISTSYAGRVIAGERWAE